MSAKLQTIEGAVHHLELELSRGLYHGNYGTQEIIFLRNIYELLEKLIGRCRDAGISYCKWL